MSTLVPYQSSPRWEKISIPSELFELNTTPSGSWAQLTLYQGELSLTLLDNSGNVLETNLYSVTQQPPHILPQQKYKIESVTDDVECQLQLLCESDQYYSKKYDLTLPHSEVVKTTAHITSGTVLDLGCGRGRNSLYLSRKGFDVTSYDLNGQSIDFLNHVISEEGITNINAQTYNIESASLTGNYDLIISTVVMMFLNRDSIPDIIRNMQAVTNVGGYNLIVCAMSTKATPCSVPFSFTFSENELKENYKEWDLIEYNENMGELHRKDANGNRIKCQFVTMLARKK